MSGGARSGSGTLRNLKGSVAPTESPRNGRLAVTPGETMSASWYYISARRADVHDEAGDLLGAMYSGCPTSISPPSALRSCASDPEADTCTRSNGGSFIAVVRAVDSLDGEDVFRWRSRWIIDAVRRMQHRRDPGVPGATASSRGQCAAFARSRRQSSPSGAFAPEGQAGVALADFAQLNDAGMLQHPELRASRAKARAHGSLSGSTLKNGQAARCSSEGPGAAYTSARPCAEAFARWRIHLAYPCGATLCPYRSYASWNGASTQWYARAPSSAGSIAGPRQVFLDLARARHVLPGWRMMEQRGTGSRRQRLGRLFQPSAVLMMGSARPRARSRTSWRGGTGLSTAAWTSS